MKKKELQECKDKLLALRDTLKAKLFGEGVFGLHGQESSGEMHSTPSHIGDLGTDIFDRDFEY